MICQHFIRRQKYVWSLGWCIFKGVSEQLQLCWLRALRVLLNSNHLWTPINLTPGLQRGTWRKKHLGSCPLSLGVSLSGHHSGLLAPGSSLSQVRDGRQWSPPSHGKGDFPEFQGITKLAPEAGTMLLEGSFLLNRLSPDPWPLLPHSILFLGALLWLGRPWKTGLETGWSKRGTTRLFPHEFSLHAEADPDCLWARLSRRAISSKWSGRAQESFVCCPSAVPAPLYLGIINCD